MSDRFQELIIRKSAKLLQLSYSEYHDFEYNANNLEIEIVDRFETLILGFEFSRIDNMEFEDIHDIIAEILKQDNPKPILYRIFALINLTLVHEYKYNENTDNFRDGKISDFLQAVENCIKLDDNVIFYIAKAHVTNLMVPRWSGFAQESIGYLKKVESLFTYSELDGKRHLIYLEYKRVYGHLYDWELDQLD